MRSILRHARCRLLAPALAATVAASLPAGALARAAPADTTLASLLGRVHALASAARWVACDSVAALAAARAQAASAPDSTALASALYFRGQSRYNRAMFTDSVTSACLARALAIERRLARPDSAIWVGAGDVLGCELTERGLPDSALVVFAAVHPLCRGRFAGADSIHGELWISIGRAQFRAERFADAIAAYDSARVLRARIDGPRSARVAEALMEIGAVQAHADDLEPAGRNLNEAIGILQGPGVRDTARLASAIASLATVQYRSGNIGRSIESLERSIDLHVRTRGPNTPYVIPPLYNIGIRLFEFGDDLGANAIFSALVPRAEASFGAGNGRTELIRYMAGASAMLLGDTAQAARHLTAARAALLSHPLDQNHATNLIEVYYGQLLEKRGDLAGARRTIAAGLARERATREPQPDAIIQLLDAQASAEMAAGDTMALDSTLRDLAATFGSRTGVFRDQFLHVAIRCERWLGHERRAWDDAVQGEEADRATLLRNVQALPDERALQLEDRLGESLEALVALSGGGGPGWIETAWDRVVRRRGLVTTELARRRAPPAAASDTALAAAHARWVEALRRCARLEVEEDDPDAAPALAASRAALNRAEQEYGSLVAAEGGVRDTALVSLARVRASLASGDALVSIVETGARTDAARLVAFATLGGSGAPRRLDLGEARPLEDAIGEWRAALSDPPRAGHERAQEVECRRLGAEVRRLTWDRIATLVAGATSVTLVADGALADLPWQALPTTSGYLVESGPVIRTPGAERELIAAPHPAGSGLLAVGDPDYERVGAPATDAARGTSPATTPAPFADMPLGSAAIAALSGLRGRAGECSDTAAIRLAALPGARAEADEIVRQWNDVHPAARADLLVGAAATERAFKQQAPGREVLHVATHGVVWGERCAPVYAELRGVGGLAALGSRRHGAAQAAAAKPAAVGQAAPAPPAPSPSPWDGRRVWLALAGANHARTGSADEDDGLLTADDVVGLDLSAVDWVVLSACQSGVGQDWPLEGSVGMRRAFRMAGARTVIASQWSVSDQSTREWMHALYAARAAGSRTAADAMRAASRAMLAARRKAHEDTLPFRWAAFTATGL